jgi:hypothetical protein
MVVHTRLRERKERERERERERKKEKRREMQSPPKCSLNTITGFSTMFLLNQNRHAVWIIREHMIPNLCSISALCVCVFCVCSNDVSRVSDDAIKLTKKKCTTSLQFSNLIGVNFFKQLIQSECVKCETLSLQYGICWRGLVNPFSKCCLPSQFGPCWFGWSRLWNEPLENRFT